MQVADALRCGRRALAALPAGALEAEVLLAHVLEAKRSFLYANPELELPSSRESSYRQLLKRRAGGEPVAYLTGHREFWSLDLRVTPSVLIPRADTEVLVEAALARIPARADWALADLGTGSGAVALALASERRHCTVWATDCDTTALDVARDNAESLGLGNLRFARGEWCEALPEPAEVRFHLIASNPPYVAANDPHLEQGDCRHEPRLALTPGGDGLAALRQIVEETPAHLADNGWLLLEHGPNQGAAVRHLLEKRGFVDVETRPDMEHRERVTLGRRATD